MVKMPDEIGGAWENGLGNKFRAGFTVGLWTTALAGRVWRRSSVSAAGDPAGGVPSAGRLGEKLSADGRSTG